MLVLLMLAPHCASAAGDASGVKPKTFSTSVMQSATPGTDSMSTGYMAQLIMGLLVVLMCIVALAWLAKRFNRLQSTPDGSLRLLGGMSMGARERIVLVQVGSRQLLLGVAPGQINTLYVLEEPLETVADNAGRVPARGFAEKLNAAINRKPEQRHDT